MDKTAQYVLGSLVATGATIGGVALYHRLRKSAPAAQGQPHRSAATGPERGGFAPHPVPRSAATEPPVDPERGVCNADNGSQVYTSEIAALGSLIVELAELPPEKFAERKWEALFLVNALLGAALPEGIAKAKAELYARWEAAWKQEGLLGGGWLNPKWWFRMSDGKPPVIRTVALSALKNPHVSMTARVQLIQSIPKDKRTPTLAGAARQVYVGVSDCAGGFNLDALAIVRARFKARGLPWNPGDDASIWELFDSDGAEPAPIWLLVNHQVGHSFVDDGLSESEKQRIAAHRFAMVKAKIESGRSFELLFDGWTPENSILVRVGQAEVQAATATKEFLATAFETAKDVAGGASEAAKDIAKILAWAPYVAAGVGVLGLTTFVITVARRAR